MNGISDIAIGHISITLERLRIVDFTEAIYQMDYGFLSRKPARLQRYKVKLCLLMASDGRGPVGPSRPQPGMARSIILV